MTPQTPQGAALSDADIEAKALEHFTDYFVRNYPGPNTIIGNPRWHAPKIFRAAQYAIQAFAAADRRLTAEQGGADAALKRIITTYDAYRRRGLNPAPMEYANVVEAIEAGRAALTTQPQAEPPSETERLLLNLLAVIHRDGGHYVEAHGLKKATADAQEWVVGQLFTQPQAEPADYRDAYEGAREDLLDWKRRALEAEQTVRQLARALGEEVNGATFMGEPAPTAQPQAEPADSIAGVLRYCGWVQESGTANERAVAQTVARMLATPTAPTEPT